MRFSIIGECMAELAPTDTTGEFRLGFAGDTFNTAWYLARCTPDAQVSYVTAVGDDAISGQMTDFMRDAGIDVSHVQTASNRTIGLYMISLKDGERSFAYWRGQSAARTLADDPSALTRAVAGADMIYFSGITLGVLPSDRREPLLNVLRQARAACSTIAFDPNLRPKLWASDIEMTTAIMQAATVSDVVLPSFEDESDWFDDSDPQATADRYLGAGAKTVIVKNGADGVLYVEGSTRGDVPVEPVAQVVDTTAAGDSFNAGVFAGMAKGKTIAEAIADACTLSRAVVQHRGALVLIEPDNLSQNDAAS